MKYCVLISILFTTNAVTAQQFDLDLWKKEKNKNSVPVIRIEDFKNWLDSLKASYNNSPMPNAITQKLPEPKLIGNNGKGHDIYILQMDNMPMIKPDSTYTSNMPNGICRNK